MHLHRYIATARTTSVKFWRLEALERGHGKNQLSRWEERNEKGELQSVITVKMIETIRGNHANDQSLLQDRHEVNEKTTEQSTRTASSGGRGRGRGRGRARGRVHQPGRPVEGNGDPGPSTVRRRLEEASGRRPRARPRSEQVRSFTQIIQCREVYLQLTSSNRYRIHARVLNGYIASQIDIRTTLRHTNSFVSNLSPLYRLQKRR